MTLAVDTGFELSSLSSDTLEQLLSDAEAGIARLRHLQVSLVREVDRRQLARTDGARTLDDWLVSRLDCNPETAQAIRRIARTETPELDDALADGVGFDRVTELARSGETELHSHLDVLGLRRMLARRRHITRSQECDVQARRFLIIQPDLFDTIWNLRGQLPALDGATVVSALDQVADTFPTTEGVIPDSPAARRVDALVAICTNGDEAPPATVTVIVDARQDPNPETGAWIISGPRVGPSTLEQLLCDTPVEVTALTTDGTPLAVGTATTAIPPRTRRYILTRDGGVCVIDGCDSTYRLQPHHVIERNQGGDNHPDNLATLCWYHHHVTIHRRGHTLDPVSPPLRRRFKRRTADPPQSSP